MKMQLPNVKNIPIGKVLNQKKTRGFTLVELLVVISIIAILSITGLTLFSGVQKNARDAKRRGDGNAIAKALEAYYLANNFNYPTSHGVGCTSANGNSDYCMSSQTQPWIPGLGTYMSGDIVPTPPGTNNGNLFSAGDYSYAYYSYAYCGPLAQGKWFALMIPLEQPTATDIATKCDISNIPGCIINFTFTSKPIGGRVWCNQQG